MPKQIEQLAQASQNLGFVSVNAIIELHNKGHQIVLEVDDDRYYAKFAVYEEEIVCQLSPLHFIYLCKQANDTEANVWFDFELTDISEFEASTLMKTFPLIKHV